MRTELVIKYNKLKEIISSCESVLVGLSGGVDSGVLAKVSHDTLSPKALGVVGKSSSYPEREERYARYLGDYIGIEIITLETKELESVEYKANAGDRCYHCKKELYSNLLKLKAKKNYKYVLDGTNLSDVRDAGRVGIRAVNELGIRMPLYEAGLIKEEVREIAKHLSLPSWDKPSFACLSSRIPVGTMVSDEILTKIEKGEDILHRLGFRQYRLRYHGDLARLEFLEADFEKALRYRKEILRGLVELGFKQVTVDLNPYQERL